MIQTRTAYANRGGNSNIAAWESADDSITVYFNDGSFYRYTYSSCGSGHTEAMKDLALAGQGLNSYLMKNCRKGYASKS